MSRPINLAFGLNATIDYNVESEIIDSHGGEGGLEGEEVAPHVPPQKTLKMTVHL